MLEYANNEVIFEKVKLRLTRNKDKSRTGTDTRCSQKIKINATPPPNISNRKPSYDGINDNPIKIEVNVIP